MKASVSRGPMNHCSTRMVNHEDGGYVKFNGELVQLLIHEVYRS